ncbi:MAG TPA: TIGR04551 family protein [Polyangiaceae bacterium]|nr:TIGR04551 family protein [Polyangiaceae bacterium]
MRKVRSGALRGVAEGIATLAIALHAPTALAQTAPPAAAPGAGAAKPAQPAQPAPAQPAPAQPAQPAPAQPAPAQPAPTQPAPAPTQPADPNATSGAPTTGGAAEGATSGDASVSTDQEQTAPATTTLPPSSGAAGGDLGFGQYPASASDTPKAAAPEAKKAPQDGEQIFAEDWWSHTRPTVELHGNFRVRLQMMHQFSLGRLDAPEDALWPRPADDYYTDLNGESHGPQLCTAAESGVVGGANDPGDARYGCKNPTQFGGNTRFRIEPAIIISDNLRVRSQIDMLDNVTLGSTPNGYGNFPTAGGYMVSRDQYAQLSGQTNTQVSPVSGVNSLQDAIAVKRAWAEYETPFGQARFGRMPDHWGLGLYHNAGDDIDGDYQSTVDRLAFATGLPSLSLYATLAWDFPYEGPTSQAFMKPGVPAYDLAQFDDLSQLNLQVFRRVDRQLEKLMLARGDVVVNGGLYLTYQFQRLANDYSGTGATCANGAAAPDCQAGEASTGYTRRGLEMWTPDLFGEVKYRKFHFAVEAVSHLGTIQGLTTDPSFPSDYDDPSAANRNGYRVNQWGLATEITQRLVEDRLKLGFYFGWASGDGDVGSLSPTNPIEPATGDRSIDTFRFHPGYRVDLILNRSILSRVQGSYYIKPMAQYDFIRNATGMRLGGRAEAIWTRATNFMQTPGHQNDLGIELNASVYFQSKDGVLNDDPELVGGLFAMIQYGVLFPMSGLGYLSQQTTANSSTLPGLETPMTVRMFMGVAY